MNHICNMHDKCTDPHCIHSRAHDPNWWCECPQTCCTMTHNARNGNHVAVECVKVHPVEVTVPIDDLNLRPGMIMPVGDRVEWTFAEDVGTAVAPV